MIKRNSVVQRQLEKEDFMTDLNRDLILRIFDGEMPEVPEVYYGTQSDYNPIAVRIDVIP